MSQRKSGYDPYVFFDYQGERLTYQDIEIRYAISRQSLMYRINVMGLSVQAARSSCLIDELNNYTIEDKTIINKH